MAFEPLIERISSFHVCLSDYLLLLVFVYHFNPCRKSALPVFCSGLVDVFHLDMNSVKKVVLVLVKRKDCLKDAGFPRFIDADEGNCVAGNRNVDFVYSLVIDNMKSRVFHACSSLGPY